MSSKYETKEWDKFSQGYARALYNAQRLAINSTLTWAKKKLDEKLTDTYHTPNRTLKLYRNKTNRGKKSANNIGKVWLGYNPIVAKESVDNTFVGRLRQNEGEDGARAGEYFYEKGFIAQFKSGSKKIVKREFNGMAAKANKRGIVRQVKKWKLITQKLPQEKTQNIADGFINEVGVEFERRYNEKIEQYIRDGKIPDLGEP